MGEKEFIKDLSPDGDEKHRNLEDALTYAEQDLKDRWEWYKERFKRGIR